MLTRLRRNEAGFGLIELVIALTVLNVGILATVAALNSGAVALRRASQLATATALADRQMEQFRAVRYAAIGLADTATADADATYRGDAARGYGVKTLVAGTCTQDGWPDLCVPIQTVEGAASPDGRSYRVDTYVFEEAPTASSRTLKVVTVVVRDGTNLSKALVRQQSTFDESTAS